MGHGREGRAERLTLVSGVLLSVVLGVFFYFREDPGTAYGTFAGLIGITITLQLESLFRDRHDREETTRRLRFIEQVESVSWMPGLLDQALDSLQEIEGTYGGTMAVDLARNAFDNCLIQLKDLQRGHYNTLDSDESPNSPVYALTERLRHSLLATTVGADLDWWLGDSGTRWLGSSPSPSHYWQLNEKAVQRGVEVKRVFIYRTWSDKLEALLNAHHESGVRVFAVKETQLPMTLRLNLIVWDGLCGFSAHHNSDGDVVSQDFTFAQHDIALMLARFKQIESTAQEWFGPAASAD